MTYITTPENNKAIVKMNNDLINKQMKKQDGLIRLKKNGKKIILIKLKGGRKKK
jgi:hypothetical protein